MLCLSPARPIVNWTDQGLRLQRLAAQNARMTIAGAMLR
jgi:hypothetical protein